MKRIMQIKVSELSGVYLVCRFCSAKYPVSVYDKPSKARECLECGRPFGDAVIAHAKDLSQASKTMAMQTWEDRNAAIITMEIVE